MVRQLAFAQDGTVLEEDYYYEEGGEYGPAGWGVPGRCTICVWACGFVIVGVVNGACTTACAAMCGPAAPLCSYPCTALVGAPVIGGCQNSCSAIGWC